MSKGIHRLPSVPSLTLADAMAIYSSKIGSDARASLAVLLDFIQANYPAIGAGSYGDLSDGATVDLPTVNSPLAAALTGKQKTLTPGANITILPDGTISASGSSVSDATSGSKGIVQLAGALGGTAAAPTALGLANAAALTSLLAALAPLASPTFTGTVTLPGDAVSALQAVTLQQLQAAAFNVGKRSRVRVATTANITIATALVTGQVLNGVTLAAGDLVLVKDQSTGSQNGVYVAGASPARASEYDTWAEFPGSVIAVYEGTVNGDTLWFCTNNDGGTLGTTAIVFVQFTAAGALLSANNLSDVANASTSRANLGAAPLTVAVTVDATGTRALSSGDNGTIVDVTNASGNAVSIGTGFNGLGVTLTWPASAAPPVLTPTGVTLNGAGSAITGAAGPGGLSIIPIGTNAFLVVGAIRANTKVLPVAVTDQTSNLVTGAAQFTFRTPYSLTLTDIRASVKTAPTGAAVIVNVKKNGTTIFSTKLQIDATSKTSVGSAAPFVFTSTSAATFAADDEVTIDIDQVGSTIAGVGLVVSMIGY